MTPHFSSVEAVRFGWHTLRAHVAPLLMLGAAGAMLSLISQALGRGGTGGTLLSAAVQVVQAGVTLVLLRAAMKLYDGEPVDLSRPGPLVAGFWYFLLGLFLYGLMVAVGLALLVVPGVLLGLAFCFAPLFIAEGQHDLVEAFRASSRLTRGARGQLFGLGWLLLGLNLLGLLALGVGVVVTVPMSALAGIYAFRRLQGRTEAATAHGPSLTSRLAT